MAEDRRHTLRGAVNGVPLRIEAAGNRMRIDAAVRPDLATLGDGFDVFCEPVGARRFVRSRNPAIDFYLHPVPGGDWALSPHLEGVVLEDGRFTWPADRALYAAAGNTDVLLVLETKAPLEAKAPSVRPPRESVAFDPPRRPLPELTRPPVLRQSPPPARGEHPVARSDTGWPLPPTSAAEAAGRVGPLSARLVWPALFLLCAGLVALLFRVESLYREVERMRPDPRNLGPAPAEPPETAEPPSGEPSREGGEESPSELDAARAGEPPIAGSPAEEPPAKEPPAKEPPAEEPPAKEPPAEEPPAEDPPAEEPPVEEPPTEEPSTEEPSTEEPSTEEPSTEEPPVKEPEAEGGAKGE